MAITAITTTITADSEADIIITVEEDVAAAAAAAIVEEEEEVGVVDAAVAVEVGARVSLSVCPSVCRGMVDCADRCDVLKTEQHVVWCE